MEYFDHFEKKSHFSFISFSKDRVSMKKSIVITRTLDWPARMVQIVQNSMVANMEMDSWINSPI